MLRRQIRRANPAFFTLLAGTFFTFFVPLQATFGWQEKSSEEPVSFARDIRPILAEKCFACHQQARNEGSYLMTSFESMLKGGDSGSEAIVAGDPDSSYLIEVITPVDGEAEMPPPPTASDLGNPQLTQDQIQLIRQWISEGAKNDYTNQTTIYTSDNPPRYNRQPNITAMDFSSDGKWLAINGNNEILIFDTADLSNQKPKTSKRLIGISSRIEALRFSPDGTRLAACGGNPGEFGELQVWDVANEKLQLSKVVSQDTLYGINWSPDGKLVSFGCTDTTVRVVDADTGKQVLYQSAHEDWVRDTVFSVDGSQLVSVGRDMTCKLIEVPTERFIDNITSITPGVLKGGIASVARHPSRDEIVIGGADGIPKVYRMNRITKRVIGDDANLVRLLPKLEGRIQSVAVSRDGKRIAAASSLNGKGAVHIYAYEFDPTVTPELKAILSKQPRQWNAEEKKKIDQWNSADVVQMSGNEFADGLYAAQFSSNGKLLAVAGSAGLIRLLDTETGTIQGQFYPVAVTNSATKETKQNWRFARIRKQGIVDVDLDLIGNIESLHVSPESIEFRSATDYASVVVQGKMFDGTMIDLSNTASFSANSRIVSCDEALIEPVGDGSTELVVRVGTHSTTVPVQVDLAADYQPEFRRDVNPILTKLGCNAGTCHGSADGKMGFKLSLRGYDPIFDLRAFTDDLGSRRVNLADPAQSLMLTKPTSTVAHVGGKLLDKNSKYYRVIHEWIRHGSKLDLESPKVTGIEIFPQDPVLLGAEYEQKMRLVATYSDGSKRDVTREGFLEIGSMEIAKVNGSKVTALRRGETPILGRFEGAFTATTLTVMGDRDGYLVEQTEAWNEIDSLVAQKWERMKIKPSGLCTDEEFIRRVYLDLTGLPPSSESVQTFAQDSRPTKVKRDELVDQLIGNESYVTHWSNKWADLLQVNRKYLGAEGAAGFRNWIRDQVRSNRPYDEFAFELLTATGSNRENPPASWFKIHRTPVDTMENTTHLFLATRFNCNKCHDHPFERWTQDQYFETAAFFAQVSLKKDPASGDMKIGGSAVEGAKPLYEFVADETKGEITHDRTREVVPPAFPFEVPHDTANDASRRQQLASWITAPENPYFATSYVNRLWGYMMGVGLIEPLDDIRAGNPPTNPQLLEYLRSEFVENDFDVQHVLRLICKSRVYQLSLETNPLNADDHLNYSHAKARRLPAEVLFDSIHFVTGSQLKIPGVKPGIRAAELPDSGVKLPSGFLSTLGRPARESVCECERSNELQLGSVLALVSGPDVARAIDDPNNHVAKLVSNISDDRSLVDAIYLRILNRHATEDEIDLALQAFSELEADHKSLIASRDARQKSVDESRPQLESERLAAIKNAESELGQAITKLDPSLLEKEAARTKAILETTTALKAYVEGENGIQAWARRQQLKIQWHPLQVASFASKTDRPWNALEDRSVLVGPKKGKDVYTLLSSTDLTGVTSIRLEVLAHDSLPAKGPGIAENGNLVLTEFEIEFAHPARPDEWTKLEFESAIANREQASYPIKNTIDGKSDDRTGWALLGAIGQDNWGTYRLKTPIGFAEGTLLRFKLHQMYDETHQVGRFRISLCRDHDVGLGLCESLVNALTITEAKRTQPIKDRLKLAFRKSDPTFAKLETAQKEASKPLKIDPEILRLREKLDRVKMPLPEDSQLVQLKKDVATSEKQLANRRLTAAQDLTWALINSPAFLFNR